MLSSLLDIRVAGVVMQNTKRRPLSSLGGSATKQKPAKRARKSMGRRVSFAPDQRLEQTHFYERVRQPVPAPRGLHTSHPPLKRGNMDAVPLSHSCLWINQL
jgi:hypothetical protein